MDFTVSWALLVPHTVWVAPAEEKLIYACWDTSLGRFELERRRSKASSFDALANKHEDWSVCLNGVRKLVLYGMAAPGYPMRARLKKELEADIFGSKARVSARASLRPSGRHIKVCVSGDVACRFGVTSSRLALFDDKGQVVAEKRSRRWIADAPPSASVFTLVYLFEVGGMDYFLRSPLMNLI